jgi:DNA-binding response OmpR family regulator
MMSAPASRILIVDDEADLAAVLRFGLQLEGYEVISAVDGEEGLRLARTGEPDLIVLDLMLPKMDGYQVCRALKFDERYRAIPVIILSARATDQDRQLARDMGADAFMSKPYEMRDLLERIRVRLEARATRSRAA